MAEETIIPASLPIGGKTVAVKADAIPPGPWTVENLGIAIYDKLARQYCGIVPGLDGYRPSLDLTDQFKAQQKA